MEPSYPIAYVAAPGVTLMKAIKSPNPVSAPAPAEGDAPTEYARAPAGPGYARKQDASR
jgi:hypothetical protein